MTMAEEIKDQKELVHFTIDGKSISVPKGTTVYNAAKELGIDIPIFCYHDRMPPFGACRVCLVEVEKMPKLQSSCTLEATEGMVVRTQAKMAEEGRKAILEFLLINHPLDCPICDRGGECPLQDQTLKYGPGLSRFFEEKRHFQKRLPLGPVLMLDRERCISCARCTRFSDIVSGDHALEFVERGYKTEVGTPDGAPVKSKYIGNTIMICPVGALTSQAYRFRARPWDNTPTKTTCTLCPVGCSMILDSRDGEIMRTRSSEMREVNDIWLCDKGWFGYQFSSSEERLNSPLIRKNGKLEPSSWDEAFCCIIEEIQKVRGNRKIAGFGGNSLTTEENYLFQKLIRDILGSPHVDHRIGMPIFSASEEGLSPKMDIQIGDCETLDAILLCGLDITEEFPVIWLRIKQAINKGAKVYYVGHYAPEVSRYFEKTKLHAPGKELRVLENELTAFEQVASASKKAAIFVGSQYLSSPQRSLILSKFVDSTKKYPSLSLNIMEGRGNSVGARISGMHPEFLPLGRKAHTPGLNALQVMHEMKDNGWDLLYVAGTDAASHFPEKLWKEARKNLGFLVVQDLFLTKTAQDADIVLPTLSFVEKGGSFVNIEHRVQKLIPGKAIPQNVQTDTAIFVKLAKRLGANLIIDTEFLEAMRPGILSHEMPQYTQVQSNTQTSTQSNKDGLCATFSHVLFDQGERIRHCSHLSQQAIKPTCRINSQEAKKRGYSSQFHAHLSTKDGALPVLVSIDDRVSDETIVIPLGFESLNAAELNENLLNGVPVQLQNMSTV